MRLRRSLFPSVLCFGAALLGRAATPCRIVDFGADVGGDFYRGRACMRLPMDVDGDGTIAPGEALTGWPLSFDEPLNPRFPEYDEHAASAVFYGGIVGHGTRGAGITEGLNNQNHELRDDFNAMAQAVRDDQRVRAWTLYFWDKRHFLNGGSTNRVVFDNDSRFGPHVSRFWNGLDDARWVVREGNAFFISEARFATEEQFPDASRKGVHRSYLVHPTRTRWAAYDPTPPYDFAFDAASAAFEARGFRDVTAVGFYLARNRLESGSQWVKWYAFEAYATVEDGNPPSRHLAMDRVGDGLRVSRAVVPYALWRDVWRTFVSNARCRDASEQYSFERDGDMGAMDLGQGPHSATEPATDLTWLDAVVWCNAFSEYEGREPCYYADAEHTQVLREVLDRNDPARWDERPAVYWKREADGFRLPTPDEWNAALDAALRTRSADALGFVGVVREWCWDVDGDVARPGAGRVHWVLGGDAWTQQHPTSTPLPFGERPAQGSFRVGFRVVRGRGEADAAPQVIPPVALANAWRVTPDLVLPPAAPVPACVPPETAAIPESGFVRAKDNAQVMVSPFHAGRTEVTFAQWNETYQWAVANGYRLNADGDMGSMDHRSDGATHSPDEPVTDLCWEDMVVWCNALSERTGRMPCYYADEARTEVLRQSPLYRVSTWQGGGGAYPPRSLAWREVFVRWHADGYRLPTQAEWQVLYREGQSEAHRLFPWQAEPTRDRVDAAPEDAGEALRRGWLAANSRGKTQPVGRLAANAFGLYDLDGNVAERVWDWPGSDYYRARNPKGASEPALFGKAVMGSCFGSRAPVPAGRFTSELPAVPRPIFGFRVVRCDAGVHPETETLDLKTVLAFDPARFDPLDGRVGRGNLRRTGEFPGRGLPAAPRQSWLFQTGGPVRSGPVCADGLVVFGSDDGSVYALDAANGTPRWRFATEGPVRASVAIVDGVVYAVSHDRHVYALDAATGALRWKHRGKSPGGTAPAVVHGLAFAGFGYGWSGELVGLRVADGSEAWRYRFEGPNALGDGVTVDGERLYTPVDDIQSSAIDLATEYRLWKHSGTPTRATMPVDGERVYYAAEGRVYALDKRTGERRWAWYPKAPAIRATGERETVCSPALAEGLVVQGWDNGEVVAIAAVDGALRWSAGTGAPVMASPAVAGGIVHTANDDGVVLALRLSDGAELWRLPFPAAVRAAPWPRDGVLYVGCDDGTVRALESTEPRP